MPIIDIDKRMSTFDPIQVKVGGKTYTVVKVLSLETFNKITKEDTSDVRNQLSVLFGVPVEEFNYFDIRAAAATIKVVMDCITSQMEIEDPTEAGETN